LDRFAALAMTNPAGGPRAGTSLQMVDNASGYDADPIRAAARSRFFSAPSEPVEGLAPDDVRLGVGGGGARLVVAGGGDPAVGARHRRRQHGRARRRLLPARFLRLALLSRADGGDAADRGLGHGALDRLRGAVRPALGRERGALVGAPAGPPADGC